MIVGVTKSSGSTFGSEIWAKRAIVGPLFGKEYNRTTIVLRTADADAAKFLAYMSTPKAAAIFRKYGFVVLPRR